MSSASLERFLEAQNAPIDGFATALKELRSTGKVSHWMWWVFPQLDGLGKTAVSKKYAIRDLAEAREYLAHPLLRSRLTEVTRVVAERLAATMPLPELMGSTIDSLKLLSSMTLFEAIASRFTVDGTRDEYATLAAACCQVLAFAQQQGYSRCSFTLARLDGVA